MGQLKSAVELAMDSTGKLGGEQGFTPREQRQGTSPTYHDLTESLRQNNQDPSKTNEVLVPEGAKLNSTQPLLELDRQQKLDSKYALISQILIEKLQIPKDQANKELIRKIAEKITSSIDLTRLTDEEVKTKTLALFENDEEFQNYTLELYKKQLYEESYRQEFKRLIDANYDQDYAKEKADERAKLEVGKFETEYTEKTKNQDKSQYIEALGTKVLGIMDMIVVSVIKEFGGGR